MLENRYKLLDKFHKYMLDNMPMATAVYIASRGTQQAMEGGRQLEELFRQYLQDHGSGIILASAGRNMQASVYLRNVSTLKGLTPSTFIRTGTYANAVHFKLEGS
jgi:hypothetical protein